MTPASSISTVSVNRAPVLTLWAAVVAERLGYARGEALTLGRSMAGLNAQSKGRALGIFAGGSGAAKRAKGEASARGDAKPRATLGVELLQRRIPAVRTSEGLRAVHDGKPMSPESVERYLESKFKEALAAARDAMEALARSLPRQELAANALALYEQFRPVIPRGKRGWGAAGVLDLELIRDLARGARR